MKFAFIGLLLVLGGCASQLTSTPPINPFPTTEDQTSTMSIIWAAAEAAPDGVPGKFSFRIRATGSQYGFVYLNTELDYRDQRNVSIAIHPEVVEQLYAKYAMDPEAYFLGKFIAVVGEAKRVKIDFITNGRRTNKYYYQTHIPIDNISQIVEVETRTE